MSKECAVEVKPSCFAPSFRMIVAVPDDRDAEEYVDELLESILAEEFRYNCEWDFVGSEVCSSLPEGYAEIEYDNFENAEAIDGAKFDDLNYLRYTER